MRMVIVSTWAVVLLAGSAGIARAQDDARALIERSHLPRLLRHCHPISLRPDVPVCAKTQRYGWPADQTPRRRNQASRETTVKPSTISPASIIRATSAVGTHSIRSASWTSTAWPTYAELSVVKEWNV